MKKCIGCGVNLQIENEQQIGYAVKIDNDFCLRCFKIQNYGEYNSYEIESEKFFDNIKNIVLRDKQKTFFYVLDVLDLQNSRDMQLEALLANEKVIVLVNKIDLLPKAVKQMKILNFVREMFSDSKIQNLKFTTVSAFNQESIKHLLAFIEQEHGEKYFIGFSNVGKSSLMTALLKEANLPSKIVVSHFFNTTLNEIEIGLNHQIKFFDTPGINKKNSLSNLVDHDQLKYFYFKKEMKQYTYQLHSGQSIVVGGMLAINFTFKNDKANDIHFYTSAQIDIHRTKTVNVLTYWNKHREHLKPKLSDQTIAPTTFKLQTNENKVIDIVLSGLGWISLPNSPQLEISVTILNDHAINLLQKMIYLRNALI